MILSSFLLLFFFKLSAMLCFIVPYLHFLNLFQAFEFVFLYCLSAGFLSWWGTCAFEQHKKPLGVQIVLCFPYQFGILIELWKLSILCPFENKESLNLKINFSSFYSYHQWLIVYEFIFILFHALIIGVNTLLYIQCQIFFINTYDITLFLGHFSRYS